MASTNQIPNHLLSQIRQALESVKYGSIEIIIQNKIVTQITVRNIHKTSMEIENKEEVTTSARLETQITMQKNSVEVQ